MCFGITRPRWTECPSPPGESDRYPRREIRWWSQMAKQEGDKMRKSSFVCNIWGKKNVMSTQMLEVSLVGVGTVLRLERDAW